MASEYYDTCDFKANGFAGPIHVLTRQEAQLALEEVEEWQNRLKTKCLEGDNRFKIHLFLPQINQIVQHPALTRAVRQALGTPYIALWSSDLNIKQPQSDHYFAPHQDATYTGLEPGDRCLTAWIALSDPVGVKEGCMSFVKGSHLSGQLPHVEISGDDNNMLSRGQRVSSWPSGSGSIGNAEGIAIPLRAGEATFHSFYAIHYSGPNCHPTKSRVGLALRYMAVDVRQTGPVRECVTWISRSDNDDDDEEKVEQNDKNDAIQQERQKLELNFDLEPVLPKDPTSEQIEQGHNAHGEAMRREASNYFHDSDACKGYDGNKKAVASG